MPKTNSFLVFSASFVVSCFFPLIAGNDHSNPLNDFGIKAGINLYVPGNNFVYSPASLAMAMGMLLEGADGATKKEIMILMFGSSSDKVMNEELPLNLPKSNPSLVLNIADFLYSQKNLTLRKDFIKTLASKYNATARELDFKNENAKALKTINDDVEKATKGMIKKFPPMVHPETQTMVVNAIYFNGLWEEGFDKKNTKNSDFHFSNGKTVKVPMMHRRGIYPIASYTKNHKKTDSMILLAEYSSDSDIKFTVQLAIILPAANQSVANFLKEFNAKDFEFSLNHKHRSQVIHEMPRFKIESFHILADTLEKLRIQNIFSDKSDLSRMSYKPISISDLVQKAIIEVNERGTEAAAATGDIVYDDIDSSPPPKPIVFKADRPFVYVLYTEELDTWKKNILFMGVVENPLEN